MSLLFDGEQVADTVVPVEPSLAEHEDALLDLTRHKSTSVAGSRLRSFERAEEMYRVARQIEPELLRGIADGSVNTFVKALAFITQRSPAWFPADKMLGIMKARAGETLAQLRAAAIREVGTGV